MKKNIVIALLAVALIINTGITFTRAAPVIDLSAFTETQQYQLANWYAEQWVAYFGSNMASLPIPETGVLRGSQGEIVVNQITVQGEGGESIVITPTAITCFNASREVICQIPAP